MSKLRVVTLCSGYDSQCLALDRLSRDVPEFEYELIAWSEIDKYACQAHDILYPQYADRNLGDMTKIEWEKVPDFDLLTFSTPCQDVSAAGLQRGIAKDSGTRSSIVWSVLDAVRIKRPRYLLQENVKALVSAKFLPYFHAFNRELEQLGYTTYSKVLNAKDYNVPQNRERIFVVSVLNPDRPFIFPKEMPLNKHLADVLEKKVDEKYYLNDEIVKRYLEKTQLNQEEGKGFGFFLKSLPTSQEHSESVRSKV